MLSGGKVDQKETDHQRQFEILWQWTLIKWWFVQSFAYFHLAFVHTLSLWSLPSSEILRMKLYSLHLRIKCFFKKNSSSYSPLLFFDELQVRIGVTFLRWKQAFLETKKPVGTKWNWKKNEQDLHSERLFCNGVPVSTTLLKVLILVNAWEIADRSFLKIWPSSHTTKSGPAMNAGCELINQYLPNWEKGPGEFPINSILPASRN